MSEYLSWTCPKCGGHEISCAQRGATITQKLRIHSGGDPDWYGDIDLAGGDDELENLDYLCANPQCYYRLPVEPTGGWSHEALYEYLQNLEENRND